MSEKKLKGFLEKVKGEASLQEKLKAAADADEVIVIAKAAGFVVSAEEIKTAQLAPQELSDEELEGVAGGYAATALPAWCSNWTLMWVIVKSQTLKHFRM